MYVSVAMATYNGQKYIKEQLESILYQTRKPDEVIICDDCSKDDTCAIIEKFIIDNSLSNSWKLFKNKENKGFVKNFCDCANITIGDIIFYSDQDDIWHMDKIKLIMNIFEKNSDAKAIGTAMSIITENGSKYHSIYARMLSGDGKLRKIEFSEQVRNNRSTGATLAVSRKLFNYVLPIIKQYNLTHDVIIGLVAAAFGGYYYYGSPLLYRRLHDLNTSSPQFSLKARLENVQQHIKGRRWRITLMECCKKELVETLSTKDLSYLEHALSTLRNSIYYIENRDIFQLIKDLFIFNPMLNKKICITNLLCAIFGKYGKEK